MLYSRISLTQKRNKKVSEMLGSTRTETTAPGKSNIGISRLIKRGFRSPWKMRHISTNRPIFDLQTESSCVHMSHSGSAINYLT